MIRTAHGSPREEAGWRQLRELLRRYDLGRWTFTGEVIIEQGDIPPSHPVLTLNTRASGDGLLAAYLHEQLHWLLAARREILGCPKHGASLRPATPIRPDAKTAAPRTRNRSCCTC